jgi:Cu2+-exporting ATPase
MADIALTGAAGCPSGLAPATSPAAAAAGVRSDLAAFVRRAPSGLDTIELMVSGARCAGCIAKIESGLNRAPGVEEARLNLSTQRLRVAWRPGANEPARIVQTLTALGYGAAPFDPETAQAAVDEEGRRLLRYLAVAGFAAMNIMMFSVPVWSGHDEMGEGTRTLLHWVSALIAIPAALYAAQPFFHSAFRALRARRANMDVPISLAVVLTLGTSVAETLQQGEHAYFDGITMLLFFLLIGRYLDHRLRERARMAARELLALQATTAARIGVDGHTEAVAARDVSAGDLLLLAPGERAAVDCVIEQGVSELDLSMLTGETLPQAAGPGRRVAAGSINLSQALMVRAAARADQSAVAELARLIETGEQSRASFVRLADRAAALYVPVVHTVAALTFLGWMLAPIIAHALGFEMGAVGVRGAVMNAVAVLIITCPCALGLAVPAVQVVATGRLFKRGVLVTSGDALERLAQADVVIFDKTGTLTLGKPRLQSPADPVALEAAASLARASHHPLSRAVVEAAGAGALADRVRETPGEGVEGVWRGRRARLGRRTFAAPDAPDAADGAPELWFAVEGAAPVRFVFADALRVDAADAVRALACRGIGVELLSGDRPAAVAGAARAAGIEQWRGGASPADKTARLAELRAQGKRTLMVGDGLNDAAALAGAHVSASPGSALDVSQAASDIVIQGALLMPLIEAIDVAKAAQARALENLRFSAVYNLIAAPAAAFGLLTPLIAALAMSSSSLIVTLNALRLQIARTPP